MDVFVVVGSIRDKLWFIEDFHAEYTENEKEEGIEQKKSDYYRHYLYNSPKKTFQLLDNVYFLIAHVSALQDQFDHPYYSEHSVDLEEIVNFVADSYEEEDHVYTD